MANGFVTSIEYYQNAVSEAYFEYLHRAPDMVGFEGWVGDLLLRESTINGMDIDLLASEEFYDKLI